MGLTVAGADRVLDAIAGQAVASGGTVRARLHTAATPNAGNELSGQGYAAVVIPTADFTRATASGYRQLQFPAMQFFAVAGATAQRIRSLGLWHGNVLVWHGEADVLPRNNRVFSDAGDVVAEVQLGGDGVTFTADCLDRALRALAGEQLAARNNLRWALHSAALPTGGDGSNTNELTGGGIDSVADVTWGKLTSGDWRRIRQTAVVDFGTMTGNANAAPASIALWDGPPETNGSTLLAYRPQTGVSQPIQGDEVTVAANELYFGVNMLGVAA